jgi:hypothetical protein
MAGGGRFGMAFFSSADLSAMAQAVHDHGDPRVARQMLKIMSETRPKWIQDLMG